MRKLTVVTFALLAMVSVGSVAKADNININDWFFNVNGTIYNPDPLPAQFNALGFDFSTPNSTLGTITATYSAAGNYSVIGFFDLDIEGGTNTLTNEVGFVHNSPGTGQSWEIGPGESVSPDPQVADDALGGTLLNANWGAQPGDVAMAIGWIFTVASDPVTLTFHLGTTVPVSGSYLYLQQVDQLPTGDLGTPSIYFDSSLTTGGTQPAVPEPGTLVLLGTGLGVALFTRFRSRL